MSEDVIEVIMSKLEMVTDGVVVDKDHTFKISVKKQKVVVHFLEIPDLLFHHNSAVPCLDEDNYLISAISSTHTFHEKHKEKHTVILGHADRSGEIDCNYHIAEYRAQSIKAILDDDNKIWGEIVDKTSRVKDYQRIFTTLSEVHKWNCHPGNADDIDGPKTKEAVRKFQETVNSKYGFGLLPDGLMGPKTWSAVLKVYCELSGNKDEELVAPYTYGIGGKGTYSCGESFPEEKPDVDSFKSQENRRAEIYFYDSDSAPTLLPPPSENQLLTFNECNIFNPDEVEIIDVPLTGNIENTDYIKIGFVNPYNYDSTIEMHLILKDSKNNEKIILGELDEFNYWKFTIQEYKENEYYDISLRCNADNETSKCFEKFDLYRYGEMLKTGEVTDDISPLNLIDDWAIVEDPLEDGETINEPNEDDEKPPVLKA